MGWCQVALIAAFVVLLQCGLQHAASCKNRKTVIQIKLSGKTNINVKFPPKSDPVKFVPFPYPNNEGQYNADCFVCNGPRCQNCTKIENQRLPSTTSRTNIIIDLRRNVSDSQNGPINDDNKNKTSPSSGTGGTSPQDATVVEIQDLTSASSVSNSASSASSTNGAQTAATSAASAAISKTDIIASMNHVKTRGKSAKNFEDIYIGDYSKSIAGGSANSNADNKTKSAAKAISKTDNSGNSNSAKTNTENTSNNGDKATSSAGGKSAADATSDENNGGETAAEVVVKATASVADSAGKGTDTATALNKPVTFDDFE